MKNKELADLFLVIADSFKKLSECYSSNDYEESEPVKEKTENKTDTTLAKDSSTDEDSKDAVIYTKEDVRAKLAQKAKADGGIYKASTKAIVSKYSSDGTLTGVPAEMYSELVAELEVIGNA